MCGAGRISAARGLTVTLETGPCWMPEVKPLRFFPKRGHPEGKGGLVYGKATDLFGELAVSIHKPFTNRPCQILLRIR